jgi:hypothetical protein
MSPSGGKRIVRFLRHCRVVAIECVVVDPAGFETSRDEHDRRRAAAAAGEEYLASVSDVDEVGEVGPRRRPLAAAKRDRGGDKRDRQSPQREPHP